jgi:hypothetical protein
VIGSGVPKATCRPSDLGRAAALIDLWFTGRAEFDPQTTFWPKKHLVKKNLDKIRILNPIPALETL